MVFAIAGHQIRETHVQLIPEQTQDAAHLSKRNAAPAQLSNDQDVHKVGCRIDAVAAVPLGNYDAPLVPPLKLPGADPGQIKNVARAEEVFQHSQPNPAPNISYLKCLTSFFLERKHLSMPFRKEDRLWQLLPGLPAAI